MKKYYVMIAATLLACASMISCQPKAEEDIKTKIELLTPADGATYDVAAGEALTISWKGTDGACKLLVSSKADLSGAVEIAGVTSPYYLQADKVDEILAGFNVAEGASLKIYLGISNGSEVSAANSVTATRKAATVIPVIALKTPDNGAVIDLNAAVEITFSWEKVADIDDYVLVFSTSSDFTGSKYEEQVGNIGSQTYATAKAFNSVMGELGIRSGATEKVYWTVITTVKKEVETQVRSFDVTRIATALVEPDNKARIELNYETPDELVTFSWADVAESYELYVGLDEAMEQSVKIADATSASMSATHSEIQAAAIDFESSPLHRYKDNTLYWNVKLPDGSWLAEKANSFVLKGMMIWTDFRNAAEGPITYKVVNIECGNYSATWMAEELKTLYSADGTKDLTKELAGTEDAEYDQMAGLGLTYEGRPNKAKTELPIPEYYTNRNIVYYRFTDKTPELLNKDGWRIPTAGEMIELFTVATSASNKHVLVLRDYDRYAPAENGFVTYDYQWDPGKEEWNGWGFNMGPTAIWHYGYNTFSYYDWHHDFESDKEVQAKDTYFLVDTRNPQTSEEKRYVGKCFMFWKDGFDPSGCWYSKSNFLVPCRLIYDGR